MHSNRPSTRIESRKKPSAPVGDSFLFARDIDSKLMEELAKRFRIPEPTRAQFCLDFRTTFGLFREGDRRKRLAAAARFDRVASAAAKLAAAVENLNDNQKAYLEEVLDRALCTQLMIAPCEAPGGWSGAPIRPANLGDLIAMLDTLSVAMSGPGTNQKKQRAKSGAPRGPRLMAEPFHHFIKRLVMEVQIARGKIKTKELLYVLKQLRHFAPKAIPITLPMRTLERLIAESRESAKNLHR
jgi:hypothetical protein